MAFSVTGSIAVTDVRDGADGTNGTNGINGLPAPRFTTRRVYRETATDISSATYTPSATITWSTGAISGLTTNWSEAAPTVSATNATKFWFSDLTFNDTTGTASTSSSNGTVPRHQTTFSGVVTFTNANQISDGTNTQNFGNLAGANTVAAGSVNGLGSLATSNTVASTAVTGLGNLATSNTSLGNIATQNNILSGQVNNVIDTNFASNTTLGNNVTVDANHVSTDDITIAGNDGSLFTNTTTIDGGQITTGSISTQYLDVDTALNLNGPNSSFLAGRAGTSDFGTAGFFIGRTSSTGNTATGFQLSHTSVTSANTVGDASVLLTNGTVQGVIHSNDAGLRMYEPIFYGRGNASGADTILTGSGNISLSAGDIHTITIQGGGGGGGDSSSWGTTSNTHGGAGGTTNATLSGYSAGSYNSNNTFSAAGGAGGLASQVAGPNGGPGAASTFGPGGNGGIGNQGSTGAGNAPASTSYGAGGGGEGAGFTETGFNNNNNPDWRAGYSGAGGEAGAATTYTIDLTNSNNNANLSVTVGAAGNGGGSGGAGQQGTAAVSGVLDGYVPYTLADITDDSDFIDVRRMYAARNNTWANTNLTAGVGLNGGTNGVFGVYTAGGSKVSRPGWTDLSGNNSFLTYTTSVGATTNFYTAADSAATTGLAVGTGLMYLEPGANFHNNSGDAAYISVRYYTI